MGCYSKWIFSMHFSIVLQFCVAQMYNIFYQQSTNSRGCEVNQKLNFVTSICFFCNDAYLTLGLQGYFLFKFQLWQVKK